MPWQETDVENFEDFVQKLQALMPKASSGGQLYWFRGQRNEGWHLEPSLARCVRSLELNADAALEIETEALNAFQSQAHLFVRPELLAKVFTTPCWWALMQHHGAPTRLLDWSVSPYVAAYFAAQHSEERAPGAIWAFCSNLLSQSIEQRIGSPPQFDALGAAEWYSRTLDSMEGQEIVMPLAFHYVSSERIVAQQGRFTLCFKVDSGHDCLIEQIQPEFVRRLVIPHKLKPEFLLRLREMNIAGSALFPGIDGLGQYVRELVDLRAHYPMMVATGKAGTRRTDLSSADSDPCLRFRPSDVLKIGEMKRAIAQRRTDESDGGAETGDRPVRI